MLFHNIFAGLRSLCSVRNAHSPHCVTAVACPPRMSPYKRDLPQGSPLHPVFVSPARRKMLFHNIFAGLRSLCSVRNAHSPHCVTAVACPPRMSPYKRDLPQGSPLHPVFLCLRPDEKCCCAPFLPGSVPCAPCAMCTHRTTSQNIFLCYVRCAYLFVQQVGAAFSCDLQRLFRAPGVHLLVVARDQYVGDG